MKVSPSPLVRLFGRARCSSYGGEAPGNRCCFRYQVGRAQPCLYCALRAAGGRRCRACGRAHGARPAKDRDRFWFFTNPRGDNWLQREWERAWRVAPPEMVYGRLFGMSKAEVEALRSHAARSVEPEVGEAWWEYTPECHMCPRCWSKDEHFGLSNYQSERDEWRPTHRIDVRCDVCEAVRTASFVDHLR